MAGRPSAFVSILLFALLGLSGGATADSFTEDFERFGDGTVIDGALPVATLGDLEVGSVFARLAPTGSLPTPNVVMSRASTGLPEFNAQSGIINITFAQGQTSVSVDVAAVIHDTTADGAADLPYLQAFDSAGNLIDSQVLVQPLPISPDVYTPFETLTVTSRAGLIASVRMSVPISSGPLVYGLFDNLRYNAISAAMAAENLNVTEGASVPTTVQISTLPDLQQLATRLSERGLTLTSFKYSVDLSFSGSATPGTDFGFGGGGLDVSGNTVTYTSSVTDDLQTFAGFGIPITAVDDGTPEGAETVVIAMSGARLTLSLRDSSNFAFVETVPLYNPANRQTNVQLTDNTALPTVSVTGGTDAAENGALDGSFAIGLSAPQANNLTVQYAISGSATPGVDYPALTGSITIPAGQTGATIQVHPTLDLLAEPDESITLTLQANANYLLARVSAGTINLLDGPAPGLVISSNNAAEIGPVAGQFILALAAPASVAPAGGVSIDYSVDTTVLASATPGTDYVALSGNARIAPGAASVQIPVTPITDALDEGDEKVAITLAGSGVIGTLLITDTPPTAPLLTFTSATLTNQVRPVISGTVDQPAGSVVRLTVDPDNDPGTDNSLTYETLGQTAGDTFSTWQVDTATDLPVAGGSVPLNGFSGPLGLVASADRRGAIGSVSQTLTVDAIPPTVAINPIGDGNLSASEDAAVTITGSSSGADGQTVLVAITDGANPPVTASAIIQAGGDWTVSGLNLAALAEGNLLVGATTTDLAGNTGTSDTLTITHDRTPPTVAINAPIGDGNLSASEASTLIVTGTSNGAEGRIINVAATDNQGRTRSGSGVIATGGAWSVGLNLSGLTDGTVQVIAATADVAGNTASTAPVPVSLDATAPSLAINTPIGDGNLSAQEDDNVSLSGTSSGADGQTVTVRVSAPGTATQVTGTAIVQAGGNWSVAGLNLSIFGDVTLAVRAELSDAAGNTSFSPPVAVLHDATPPSVNISPVGDGNLSAQEDGNVTVSGTSSGADGRSLTVTISDGSRVPVTGVAVIQTGGAWTVSGLNLASLADGTLSVSASTTDAAGNTGTGAPLSIGHDRIPPTLNINTPIGDGNLSANEVAAVVISGTAIGAVGQTVQLTITDGIIAAPIIATALVQIDGSWSTGALDLSALLGTVIDVGATVLDVAGNPSLPATASVRHDWVAGIAATDPLASEFGPGQGVYRISLDRAAPVGGLSIGYVIGGSAQSSDYSPLNGRLVIPGGQTSGTVTFTAVTDGLVEGNETVTLTLAPGGSYLVGAPATATVTIIDAPTNNLPVVQLPVGGRVKVSLIASNAAFTDTLAITNANVGLANSTCAASATSGVSGTPIVTGLLSSPGCAADLDADTTTAGVQSFQAGTILNLQLCVQPNPPQSCVFRFNNPLNNAADFDAVQISALPAPGLRYRLNWEDIEGGDDDFNDLLVQIEVIPPTVSIQASDATAAEERADPGRFTLTLDQPAPPPGITVAYTQGGSAASDDYVPLSGTITIPTGQTSATIDLIPVTDNRVEGDETVTLNLQSPADGSYLLGGSVSASVTIADLPLPVASIRAESADASEMAPSPRTLRVSLDRPAPQGGLQVGYATGGTATAGVDFTALSGSLAIAEGETNGQIRLTPIADKLSEGRETVTIDLLPGSHYRIGAAAQARLGIADTVPFRRPWGVLQVVAGDDFNCALLSDASTKCWGRNDHGQLGRGDTTDQGSLASQMGNALLSVDFGSGRHAVRLAAGPRTACAVLDDGGLKCWGANSRGALGQGDSRDRGGLSGDLGDTLSPIDLGGGAVEQVVLGAEHACALLEHGEVKCWGANDQGQSGVGDNLDRGDQANEMGANVPPVKLGSNRRAVELAAALNSTCARLENGDIKCWGANGNGELGQGDGLIRGDSLGNLGDNLPPVDLGAGRHAIGLTAMDQGYCALLEDRQVKCWGANSEGQLGQGDNLARGGNPGELGDALAPIALGTGLPAADLSAASGHACSILSNGLLKCWGSNSGGELGLGDSLARGDQSGEMGDALAAVDLGAGRSAVALVVGRRHTCARLDDQRLKCWGASSAGNLGLGLADGDARGDQAGEMGDTLPALDLGNPVPDLLATIIATQPGASEVGPESGRFTVNLSRPAPEEGVVLAYTVSGTAGIADYQPLAGQVAIAAGAQSAAITLDPIVDNQVEGPETVTLSLIEGVNYSLGIATSATVNISDTPLPFASISASQANASEVGPTAASLTITLDRPAPDGGIDIPYQLSGSGLAGIDYVGLSGALRINAGESSALISILPIADDRVEGLETVVVTLSAGVNYLVNNDAASAAATIADTPPPAVSVTASDASAAERGADPGEFTINLSQPAPAGGITIDYMVSGTATNDADFDGLSGTVTIPAGASSATIRVNIRNDRLREGSEEAVLTLLPSGGYALKGNISAAIAIADSERPPPSGECRARQLELALSLANGVGECLRKNLANSNPSDYTSCKTEQQVLFASQFDQAVEATDNCALNTAGAEVADLWGDLWASVADPLISAVQIQPKGAFRPSARLRRFATVSKVVERNLRTALRAEASIFRGSARGAAKQLRGDAQRTMLRRIRNLRASRRDYTGPDAREFARLVNAAIDAVVSQVSTPDTLTAVQIVAGQSFSCARLNNLTVKCWGANDAGQLGRGDTRARGAALTDLTEATATVDLGGSQRVLGLAAGDRHVCARLKSGQVKCWGDNQFGQLGLGDSESRGDAPDEMGVALAAVDLGEGRTAQEIFAGGNHTCVLRDDGVVRCWGDNRHGQLGLGDTSARGDQPGEMGSYLPNLELHPGSRAQSLALGASHTCAQLDDGTAQCWGDNHNGALGLGDRLDRGDQPGEMGAALAVLDLNGGVAALSAGDGFTCAVFDTGTVSCWGNNASGQLGNGLTTAIGDAPSQMGTLLATIDLGNGAKASRVDAGASHVCAVLDAGQLKCWGGNVAGQLGLGDSQDRGSLPGQMGDNLPPVDLGGFAAPSELALGRAHTCARSPDGAVKCWGANSDGTLGIGAAENRGNLPGQMGGVLPKLDFGSASRLAR